jgi:hypothetical protein
MKRTLIVTLIVLAGSVACSLLPWAKSGPQESFIVFTSDTIGELKPCG